VLRKPNDRRSVDEELEHVIKSVAESKSKPIVIGFCCQYGLFGTGSLGGLWRGTKAGVWIIPVPCIAKVEADQIVRAFTVGAEGVFIAGCGEQCARENTAARVQHRVEKVRKILGQIGFESERLQTFIPKTVGADPVKALDEFIEQIGSLYLASVIKEEVKS